MIKEFEHYHGVVFSRLLHKYTGVVTLRTFPTKGNSSYVINDRIGIYIKYSTKRMSPWRFSFTREHQDEIREMRDNLDVTFLLMVCKSDGIVALSYPELKNILDENHEEVEWVSVSRKPRGSYVVKGADGKLPYRANKNDFPDKLFEYLEPQ